MKLAYSILFLSLTFVINCSTTARFNVPKDHELWVHDTLVSPAEYGQYVRRPMSWGTAGGIRYMLKKNGEVVQTGTLKSHFRVASIFWPPVALAYWPMGFSDHTYDFTQDNLLVRPANKTKK